MRGTSAITISNRSVQKLNEKCCQGVCQNKQTYCVQSGGQFPRVIFKQCYSWTKKSDGPRKVCSVFLRMSYVMFKTRRFLLHAWPSLARSGGGDGDLPLSLSSETTSWSSLMGGRMILNLSMRLGALHTRIRSVNMKQSTSVCNTWRHAGTM